MRRVLLAAAAATLLAAAPAGAVIVAQQGMAGLKLGMTEAQVRAKSGKPDSSTVMKNDILGHVRIERYGAVRIEFDGTKTSSKVITFDTTGTAERTNRGIGVGTKRADVLARVPHVKCRLNDGGYNHCFVGRFGKAGATVTDFAINSHGRVGRVTIGIVID
jgi:hypothetical protein